MTDASGIDPRAVSFDVPPEVWEQIPEIIRWTVWAWRSVRFLLPLLDGDGRRVILVDLTGVRPRVNLLKVSQDSSIWELAKTRRVLYLRSFAPTVSVGPSSETD